MGFSRQEYWSGLPFPSPGDLPDPGIKPGSPTLEANALTSEPPGKPICRVHHKKHWAGWNTSWNQDCQEKYQYPHICRWHHPYGRKWRAAKKPLDEIERGEWKSWIKAQHSENEDHGIWSHHFMGNTPVFFPWAEEPGGLEFMEFQSVRHSLVTQQQQNPSKVKKSYIST